MAFYGHLKMILKDRGQFWMTLQRENLFKSISIKIALKKRKAKMVPL
jgi:hypothetical protein